MLSVEIIKLAIIVKQKRDIGSTYALSKGRFFLRYDTLTRYDTLCVVNSKLLKIRYENSFYAMRF